MGIDDWAWEEALDFLGKLKSLMDPVLPGCGGGLFVRESGSHGLWPPCSRAGRLLGCGRMPSGESFSPTPAAGEPGGGQWGLGWAPPACAAKEMQGSRDRGRHSDDGGGIACGEKLENLRYSVTRGESRLSLPSLLSQMRIVAVGLPGKRLRQISWRSLLKDVLGPTPAERREEMQDAAKGGPSVASASPAGASELHLPLLSSVGPRPAPPSVRGWGPTWEGPVGPWARLPLPAEVVAVLVSSTVTKSVAGRVLTQVQGAGQPMRKGVLRERQEQANM